MKRWIFIFSLFVVFSCRENEENKIAEDPNKLTVVNHLTDEIKNHPDSAGLRLKLIRSLDSLEMYKEAILQTDSLIKNDSLNYGLWFQKGQLQESDRDTPGAILSYTRAAHVYPSADAQLSLANLFAETKNSKALSICNEVKRLGMGRETDAGCNFIAGVYYARTGDNMRALQLFDQAINDNYTLMEAYMEKGFIYYDTKNYQEALKVFERATTVNNTYADAYYWKGKCNEATGNKTDALLNYQRSLGLDKKLKEAAEAIKRLGESQ